MQLHSRIRASLDSAKAYALNANASFDQWAENNLTPAGLRTLPARLWHATTRKDFVTPAHFTRLKKSLRSGTSLAGQAAVGLGKGWVGLQEKIDDTYQNVSRPVAMAGLGLIYNTNAKLEARRYQRQQTKLLRQSNEIASQLRELAKLRPDFTFEQQLKPDNRTGYSQVVFTTNLPNTSNLDAPSTITLSHKSIETWGLGAKMGNKTLKQLKGLLGSFVPEPQVEPSGFGGHQMDFGDPLPGEAVTSAAEPTLPDWERDVVPPTKPADPQKYMQGQAALKLSEAMVELQLADLQKSVPGLKYTSRPIHDEHRGLQRIVITTNIPSVGSETKGSDTLKIILSPDLSELDNIRVSGLGKSGDGAKELDRNAALKFMTKIAGVQLGATPTATAHQPETPAPVSESTAMPLAKRIAEATAFCEQLAQDNPTFKFMPVSNKSAFIVCTNIPGPNNTGSLRLVITPDSSAAGTTRIDNWKPEGPQSLKCSDALNQLNACAYLHKLPISEDPMHPRNIVTLRMRNAEP